VTQYCIITFQSSANNIIFNYSHIILEH